MAREINLVPDVKGEMIKTLKLRNLIFFLCIIVAGASIAVTLLFAVIAGGQQAVVAGKKSTLDALSSKLNDYDNLSDFLTIKDQLGNLSSISTNKKLLSRTFTILSALLPKGADTITISELDINLSADKPIISFDAQANAGEEPYFDYRVLESFKKSTEYMRYDYGDYVDQNGNTIPAYCMIDSGTDGATFSDLNRGYYAYWLINGEGCNPSADTESNDEETTDENSTKPYNYTYEEYNGQQVVRIWRTPQVPKITSSSPEDWYIAGHMTLDGAISGIPHFESKCISYTGIETGQTSSWTSSNDACVLISSIPTDIDSSNGRDASGELVLRFSIQITINPEVYNFNNHHVIAIGPTGRYNVTDSYAQIQDMFGQRAVDCTEDDVDCANDANKKGGQ